MSSTVSTLIQSVRLVDPLSQSERVTNVLLSDGKIQSIDTLSASEIADLPRPPSTVIDGTGCVLGPGLVDLYSQSSEPGHESREPLSALLTSARAGGFSRVGILPTKSSSHACATRNWMGWMSPPRKRKACQPPRDAL